MCQEGRSDLMSGSGNAPEPKGDFESVLVKDCSLIKEQLRSLNGVIGNLSSFLRPVSVDIPVAVSDEKKNASGAAPLSPVARELKDIAEMIEQIQVRIFHMKDRIRT